MDKKLDSVQHKFSRYLALKAGNPIHFCEVNHIGSIGSQPIYNDLCFVQSLKLNLVNCNDYNLFIFIWDNIV